MRAGERRGSRAGMGEKPKNDRLKHIQVNKCELKGGDIGVDSWLWLMEESWSNIIEMELRLSGKMVWD